jgi:hypothetical protein
MIAITRVDDESETLLDAIPLVDIEAVKEMLAGDEAQLGKDRGMFINAFMITTVPGGHNSGRTYYLQTDTTESYSALTRLLVSSVKEARKRAEFNTRFRKTQYILRRFFNSPGFQYFSAFLIILVRPLPHARHFAQSRHLTISTLTTDQIVGNSW